MKSGSSPEPIAFLDFVIYASIFIAVFWGFTLVPSGWLERITAEASSNVLGAMGFSSGWGIEGEGSYLTLFGGTGSVKVTIIRECTAINVFSIMVALILPLRGGLWVRKIIGVAFSGLILFALNVSRIILTVLLTGFSVPPFSWFLSNPNIMVYHYPISFIYGVIGVAALILMVNKWILPELGNTLTGIFELLYSLLRLVGSFFVKV